MACSHGHVGDALFVSVEGPGADALHHDPHHATVTTWDRWPVRPNGAVLLQHLGAMHPAEVVPYLDRMAAGEDIANAAAEASKVIEEEAPAVEGAPYENL